MTAVVSSTAHLAQEQLSEKDRDILTGLELWVVQATFNPETNVCIDAGLKEILAPLGGMDLSRKVKSIAASLPSLLIFIHTVHQSLLSHYPFLSFKAQSL